MAKLAIVPLRRRREGKTNYPKRFNLLKSRGYRCVIRPSLQNMNVQMTLYSPAGDKVVAATSSQALAKFGWNIHKGNTPAAYLTGYLLGKKAKKKGITTAVVDTGLRTPTKGGRIYACVKGIVDAGIEIPHSADVLPATDRIEGKHITKEVVQLVHATKKKIDEAK